FVQRDGEPLQAAHDKAVVLPFQAVRVEWPAGPQRHALSVEAAGRGLRLQRGEQSAKAAVHAEAEREVPIGVPADVELVRTVERLRVAIRGAEAQQELVARADLLPADLDVPR